MLEDLRRSRGAVGRGRAVLAAQGDSPVEAAAAGGQRTAPRSSAEAAGGELSRSATQNVWEELSLEVTGQERRGSPGAFDAPAGAGGRDGSDEGEKKERVPDRDHGGQGARSAAARRRAGGQDRQVLDCSTSSHGRRRRRLGERQAAREPSSSRAGVAGSAARAQPDRPAAAGARPRGPADADGLRGEP